MQLELKNSILTQIVDDEIAVKMSRICNGSNSEGGMNESSYNCNAQSICKGIIEENTQATCISGPVAIKILRSLCAHVTADTLV